jgi:hypothetical protein
MAPDGFRRIQKKLYHYILRIEQIASELPQINSDDNTDELRSAISKRQICSTLPRLSDISVMLGFSQSGSEQVFTGLQPQHLVPHPLGQLERH